MSAPALLLPRTGTAPPPLGVLQIAMTHSTPAFAVRSQLAHSSLASRRPQRAPGWAVFGLVAIAAACSSGDDEDGSDPNALVVRNTSHAAALAAEPLLTNGDWLAYRISEAGQGVSGTDFNEDGDFIDSIAVRYNTAGLSAQILDVAVIDMAFARRTLLMTVDEALDGEDWNMDMDMNDRVLLYHTPNAPDPVFLDELPATSPGKIVSVGGTVVYESAVAPTAAMETNLRTTTVATSGAVPSMPEMVLTGTDPMNDGISFEIIASDGDIVFLLADEGVDGELNGDGDDVDDSILAVLDAGATSPVAVNTALAFATGSKPTAVPVSGGGEWLVAFLADEVAQDANLNAANLFSAQWQPTNCSGFEDTDEADAVLHWFQMTDLAMGTPAVNTGLVGSQSGTAYALRSQFVGVVTPESGEGSGGGCDLNDDTDKLDNVFRWVAASNPAATPLPIRAHSRLLAVDTAVPGGTGGVIRMQDAWVILVQESAGNVDYDGQPGTDRKLAGVHNPTNGGQVWNFMHGSSTPRPIAFSWMSEDPQSSSRFFAAVTEESLSLGAGTDFNLDGDDNDSLPTIPAIFTGNRLTFPGVQVATSRSNSGLTVKENVGVHRVSEADQGNTDLNGDGDTADDVLQRFSLVGAFNSTTMATSNSANTPATAFDRGDAAFGAFLTEEFLAGGDLNGDGDTNDSVVRFFRLP